MLLKQGVGRNWCSRISIRNQQMQMLLPTGSSSNRAAVGSVTVTGTANVTVNRYSWERARLVR